MSWKLSSVYLKVCLFWSHSVYKPLYETVSSYLFFYSTLKILVSFLVSTVARAYCQFDYHSIIQNFLLYLYSEFLVISVFRISDFLFIVNFLQFYYHICSCGFIYPVLHMAAFSIWRLSFTSEKILSCSYCYYYCHFFIHSFFSFATPSTCMLELLRSSFMSIFLFHFLLTRSKLHSERFSQFYFLIL